MPKPGHDKRHKKPQCFPLPQDKVRALRADEDVWATIQHPNTGETLRVRFASHPRVDWFEHQGPAIFLKDGLMQFGNGDVKRVFSSYCGSVIGVVVEEHPREKP